MLGRIVHYGVDAVVLSALLAGVKRSAGLTIDTERFPDPTSKSVAEKYLGVGEFIFDSTVAAAHASKFFIRSSPTSTAPLPSGIDKFEQPKPASNSWWK